MDRPNNGANVRTYDPEKEKQEFRKRLEAEGGDRPREGEKGPGAVR